MYRVGVTQDKKWQLDIVEYPEVADCQHLCDEELVPGKMYLIAGRLMHPEEYECYNWCKVYSVDYIAGILGLESMD